MLDPGDRITVRRVIEFFQRDRFLLKVWHDEELQSVLQKMKKAKTHIALVQDVNNAGEVGDCWLAERTVRPSALFIVVHPPVLTVPCADGAAGRSDVRGCRCRHHGGHH